MNDFYLIALGDGAFALSGRFDLSNVGRALTIGQKFFSCHDDISIDLGEADCASTAGIALLLEWSTWSRANGKRISYTNAANRLIALARLNEVEQLIEITSN